MLLAHSKNETRDVQTYQDHIIGGNLLRVEKINNALEFYTKDKFPIEKCSELAYAYHDLGKLDPRSQMILRGEVYDKYMLNHVDAGTSHLLNLWKELDNDIAFSAAMIIDGHHKGICRTWVKEEINRNWSWLDKKNQNIMRDNSKLVERYPQYANIVQNNNIEVKEYVDAQLQYYLDLHHALMPKVELGKYDCKLLSPMEIRIAAASVFDSDHSDTASLSGFSVKVDHKHFQLRAAERLQKLDSIINKKRFRKDGKINRSEVAKRKNRVRRMIYQECRKITKPGFYNLDGYVGTGKTLSSFAAALSIANANGSRRIFYVAPYMNILDQTTNEIRQLVLDEESLHEKEVVACHHHRSDYGLSSSGLTKTDQRIKSIAVGWYAPITITTAVQFMETLASNSVVQLKKLHNISGSVIIIDEFDNTMPIHLWQVALKWLKELVKNWGCSVIFASGTSVPIWDINPLKLHGIKSENIIKNEECRELMNLHDKRRVKYEAIYEPLTPEELINYAYRHKGPRLIICNTIQNAAYIAHLIREKYGKNNVYHISTALAISDRKRILKEIKERLKNANRKDDPTDEDITVVATTCIESGIDLSFRHVFREEGSYKSVIQTGGRCSRDKRWLESKVVVFRFTDCNLPDGTRLITRNPQLNKAISAMWRLWDEDKDFTPEKCKVAIKDEIQHSVKEMESILSLEKNYNFNGLNEEFKVINEMSSPVLMYSGVFGQVANMAFDNEDIRGILETISESSCSIFYTKLENKKYKTIKLTQVLGEDADIGIYGIKENHFQLWDGGYDAQFLGYMSEIFYQMGLIDESKRGLLVSSPIRKQYPHLV